jgi:hypothetical protein
MFCFQAKFLGVTCHVGEFCCKRRRYPGSRVTAEAGTTTMIQHFYYLQFLWLLWHIAGETHMRIDH